MLVVLKYIEIREMCDIVTQQKYDEKTTERQVDKQRVDTEKASSAC
jgi:hypothetical protein